MEDRNIENIRKKGEDKGDGHLQKKKNVLLRACARLFWGFFCRRFEESSFFFGPWNLIALQLNITVVWLKTNTAEREVGRGSKPEEDLSGR